MKSQKTIKNNAMRKIHGGVGILICSAAAMGGNMAPEKRSAEADAGGLFREENPHPEADRQRLSTLGNKI